MIPLSDGVPGRASRPSRSRDDDDSGLQYVSWKSVRPLMVFPSKGIYRRKGDVRGLTRVPHHLVARPGGGPRHPMVRLPSVPLRLSFGLRLHVTQIGNSAFILSNSDNISCITILKHKNSRK
jgi:hypothetical protein